MRAPLSLLLLLLLLALAGCAGQATPDSAAVSESPEDVARTFVTALGTWDEPTLRRIAIAGTETELRLSSQRGQWARWTKYDLEPQEGVEVVSSSVDGDQASLELHSTHPRGVALVRVSLQRIDGIWRVTAWDSSRPLDLN